MILVVIALSTIPAAAQDTAVQRDRDDERELGWSNVANLSFVTTAGNTSNSTFSFDDKLTRVWSNAEFSVLAGALRVRTTDDPFAIGTPDDFRVVEDDTRELDNERYYIWGRYDRDITRRFFWVVGGGWDRDKDAGIANRTIVFGGLGNTWYNREDMRLKTDYAITFTRRIDDIPDPERDERFSEARLSWDYMNKIGARNTVNSNFVFFFVVDDPDDYRFNTINSLTTDLSDLIALQFSVQWIYQNVPALEEIDLFNEMGLETGSVVIRKKSLDTVMKFSVVFTL